MRKVIKTSLHYLIGIILLITIIFIKLHHNPSDSIPTSLLGDLAGGARSAVVMEVASGRVLYEKNAHERLLTASIAKILTAITAIERMNLADYVLVDSCILEAIGSNIYLKLGDFVCLKDLLYGVMLESGNDASLMVAKSYSGNAADFIVQMNELVKKLKMNDSSFENPTGLDEKTKNYSSAYDMCLLTSYAMQNRTFREIAGTKKYQFATADNRHYYLNHKHRLLHEDKEVIAGKTGYTKHAGRTLVTVFKRDGMEIVVCTFKAGNDWAIHRNLANWAFSEYSLKVILSTIAFQINMAQCAPQYTLLKPVYYPLRQKEEIQTAFVKTNAEIYPCRKTVLF